MKVNQIINSIFNSNTYLLFCEHKPEVWAIDPGDSEPILNWLRMTKKILKGILITHSHFDHIYGVNNLCNEFSETKIFASKNAINGFISSKENGSYYLEIPFVIKSKNIQYVDDNDEIVLFKDRVAQIINTPGHNNDCISYKVNNYFFTGDSLIVGSKIHTKSRFSNKFQVIESINNIFNRADNNTFVCPGHGDMISFKDIDKSRILEINQNRK